MIAFEAATPFQIFNAINIYKGLDTKEGADLFVYTYATDLRKIAASLNNKSIFRKIYVIDKKPDKTGLKTLWSILFYKSFLNGCRDLDAYNSLYISYTGLQNLLLYNNLRSNNNQIKLYFYEDGVSSYYNNFLRYSYKVEWLCKLRGLKIETKYIEAVFLYEPKLNKVNYPPHISIKKINPCSRQEVIDTVLNVYGVTENSISQLNKYNCLYFDHNFRKYLNNDEFYFNFNQNKIVNSISEITHQIMVKISPLEDEKSCGYSGRYVQVSNFDKSPWEVLIYQDMNINNRCLITVCSNAVITPKSVFGKEPYVLILGKALYNEKLTNSTDVWTPKMDTYYMEIKKLYNNPQKFCVAETIEEAIIFIKSLQWKN